MSKVFKAVGAIAGVVATVASFIPGGQGIAAIAGAISAVSSTLATLTAKPPAAQGGTTNVKIDPNGPMPYCMGFTYVGGHVVHDVGYGPKKKSVENPNRSTVYIYSSCGPIQAIEQLWGDFNRINPSPTDGAVGGYYEDHFWYTSQLGYPNSPVLQNSGTPEGVAGFIPNWGQNHKLSSYAAGITTLKFDKDGEVMAAGMPQHGVTGRWVSVYDPRKDSTYPGGAGAHRITDESTWEYSENPALHALTYAYGRYSQNPATAGKKIFGIGMPIEALDVSRFVTGANVCDANGWVIGGTIYEPGDKWNNLKLILEAGGMSPIWRGTILSVRVPMPAVAMDTITIDDLAEGQWEVPAMQPWRNRVNSGVASFRSPAHKWEYIPTNKIIIDDYVAEDGEEKPFAHTFTLVQAQNQAAQLMTYKLVDGREIGPIVLPLKPRFLGYKPGDFLRIDIPELGLDHICEVTGKDFNAVAAVVKMSFTSSDPAKHPFALGRTALVPPTPAILTNEEIDGVAQSLINAENASIALRTSTTIGLHGQILSSPNSITIQPHQRVYGAGLGTVDVVGGTIIGLTPSTEYYIYYDDEDFVGGEVDYFVADTLEGASYSDETPYRHFVSFYLTPNGQGGPGLPVTPGFQTDVYGQTLQASAAQTITAQGEALATAQQTITEQGAALATAQETINNQVQAVSDAQQALSDAQNIINHNVAQGNLVEP